MANNLGLLCILEAKVNNESINDLWFVNSHKIFNTEESINNFEHSNPGRIWIKWNPSIITFSPLFIASQIIHGTVNVGTQPPVLISVIYAANNVNDRNILWDQLRNLVPDPSMAWVIMGDFNCYRSEDEKSGGQNSHNSQLGELNKVIFDCGLLDLASVGLFYTWYNQRLDSPIHIKLDRMLTNNAMLERFHDAFYKILKISLKSKNWSSSCYLLDAINDLKYKQQQYIVDLQENPLNRNLNLLYKQSCDNLNILSNAWTSWLSQIAKTNWLRNGENDLGFLFAHIRSRNNINVIKEISTSEGKFDNKASIADAIIKHFKEVFNSPKPVNENDFNIPVGNIIPSNLVDSLTLPFTDLDIKNVVFNGSSSSAPGPDGPISLCNVFYKIIAKLLANRMKTVLPFIIHESQAGFIHNRSTNDNILLASEMLREFNFNSNLFCAKLDIKKTFDTVSRNFLINRMRHKGFPDVFINWIKCCISNVHFSICLNGSLEGFFNSSSGLS
ncbi:uncharacterized protein LOC114580904 [Dendrobium catenatum]|uniref:uncharacterized protein LOC114580904 n=1 Tax=Dendrobium catenatum TaxID=906689 RepID=UPI00109F64F2|nr:uncharacterized protein LOC114580904 [Dendrobium catenatum]